MRKALLFFAAGLLLLAGWYIFSSGRSPDIHSFQGLSGPGQESPLPKAATLSLQRFEQSGPNRLAVLVTGLVDPSPQSGTRWP